jgi:hypothetical protein
MRLTSGTIWISAAILLSAAALLLAGAVGAAVGLTSWAAGTYGMWKTGSRPPGLWLPRHLAIARWGLRVGAVAATGMFLVPFGRERHSDIVELVDVLVPMACNTGQWAALLASPLLYAYLATSLRLLEHRRLALVAVTVAGMLAAWSSLMVCEMHWPDSPAEFEKSFDRMPVPGLGATIYWAVRNISWRGLFVLGTLDAIHLIIFGLGCIGTALTLVLLPATAHAMLRDRRGNLRQTEAICLNRRRPPAGTEGLWREPDNP